jgi:hypothetical protein
MNCETFRDSALDWLEGSLGDAAGFRAHRAACPACAALLAGFEDTERVLRGARVPAAPPELWSRVAAAIARPARPRWIPFAAAAAILLALAGLVAAGRPPRPELPVTIVDAGPALGAFVPRYEPADAALALGD